MFLGRGGMRGVGIQQMFLVGFAVARLPGPDGRPVWSAPCPLRITAAHLGVGVGRNPLKRSICIAVRLIPNLIPYFRCTWASAGVRPL